MQSTEKCTRMISHLVCEPNRLSRYKHCTAGAAHSPTIKVSAADARWRQAVAIMGTGKKENLKKLSGNIGTRGSGI